MNKEAITPKKIAVYPYPADYAREHEELEQYRTSRKANILCKEAIEETIRLCFDGNYLDEGAVPEVAEKFGYERMLHVLATTVREKEHDGRFSYDNKAWARTVHVFEDPDGMGRDRNVDFVVESHPAVLDGFISMARHEYLLTQPLSQEEIRAEAQRLLDRLREMKEPNSPHQTHFMAQVHPDFLFRANIKARDTLLKYLPFNAMLSPLKDQKGLYVFVERDEERGKPLRKVRASVRAKLMQQAKTTAPNISAKSKDQER